MAEPYFSKQERVKKQENFWRRRFKGEIPVLNLPCDFPRPLIQSHEGGMIRFELPPETTAALKTVCFETKHHVIHDPAGSV